MIDKLPTSDHSPIRLVSSRYHAGYLPSMRQPALIATLQIDSAGIGSEMLSRFDTAVKGHLPEYDIETVASDAQTLCRHLAKAIEALLYSAGMPVFSQTAVIEQQSEQFEITLPVVHDEAAGSLMDAFEWVCSLYISPQTAGGGFTRILSNLKKMAPKGINTIRLLEAADRHSIPWHYLANGIFQFGWGSRARLFNSTLTDATPMISVAAASNKAATARILREAGLPVPEHEEARDQLHALEIAKRLGYPVVIKPLALAQGKGVAAGLKTPDAVKKAYKQADMISRRILVEKHFEGNDYRLHVCNGEVYYASHRIPGGIIGDGRQTVETLIAQLNADPRRAPKGNRQEYMQIPVDEEVLDLLNEQHLTLQSIPEKGEFVRLRRIANVSAGGTHERLDNLDEIHPDNRRLAVRAAAALRLDIAAVDFLSPDIRRSWMETGGIICEVNAQPQVRSLPLFEHLLQSVIGNNGRIPVILALGAGRESSWITRYANILSEQARTVGISSLHEISLGKNTVSKAPMDAFAGSLVLTGDPSVDAAVICVHEPRMLENGLAVDRFDALVISLPQQHSENEEGLKTWDRLASMLLPMCAGPVIIDERTGNSGALTDALKSEKSIIAPADTIHTLLAPPFPGKER